MFLLGALLCAVISCGEKTVEKPDICAHRGFWHCEAAQDAENSIASLRLAQENGLWGSEMDIHLSADGVVVVNHDHIFHGLVIAEHSYEELAAAGKLKNGESLPTFEEYAAQGKLSPCVLVVELKPQPTREGADKLLDNTVRILKEAEIFDPSRAMFISFDLELCKRIGAEYPQFTNQYLGGRLSPSELKEMGINGLDYHFSEFRAHPEWVEEAHSIGMSANVWTVDNPEDMAWLIGLGVDSITTNEPLLLRSVIKENNVTKNTN